MTASMSAQKQKDKAFWQSINSGNYQAAVQYVAKKKLVLNNMRDNNNRSALHIAVNTGNYQLAEALIRDHINLNAQDNGGDTAAHIAARNKNFALLMLLAQNGADLTLVNNQQDTIEKIAESGELRADEESRSSRGPISLLKRLSSTVKKDAKEAVEAGKGFAQATKALYELNKNLVNNTAAGLKAGANYLNSRLPKPDEANQNLTNFYEDQFEKTRQAVGTTSEAVKSLTGLVDDGKKLVSTVNQTLVAAKPFIDFVNPPSDPNLVDHSEPNSETLPNINWFQNWYNMYFGRGYVRGVFSIAWQLTTNIFVLTWQWMWRSNPGGKK